MRNFKILYSTIFLVMIGNLLFDSCSPKHIAIIVEDEVFHTVDSDKFYTTLLGFSYSAPREGCYKRNNNKFIFYSTINLDSTYKCDIFNAKQDLKDSSTIIINSKIPSFLFEIIISDTLGSELHKVIMPLEDVHYIQKMKNIVKITITEKNLLSKRVFNFDRIALTDTIVINAQTTTYVDTFHIDTIDISKFEIKQTKDTIFYFRAD